MPRHAARMRPTPTRKLCIPDPERNPTRSRSHRRKKGMAAEEGAVIACHNRGEFDSQMNKAKETGKLVVIDFTASWCGPCRFIAPVFAELAKKHANVIFLKVDVDELKDVAAEYNIEAMPTFLFIKNGEKVETVVGARKDDLVAKVAQHQADTAATVSA